MGESSTSNDQITLVDGIEHTHFSRSAPVCETSIECVEGGSRVSTVDDIIEKSKSHWSHLVEFESDNEVAEESNVEFFRTLQGHPEWGSFFPTFGEGEDSLGELVLGKKFGEGAQAEIYEVQIMWRRECNRTFDPENKLEYVLKVFKKGTFLRQLETQWPQGIFQFHVDSEKRAKLGLPPPFRMHCDVLAGILLEDGRFAFLMVKEKEDLRSMLDRRLASAFKEGPLSQREALKAMYEVAFGMDQLHSRGIVHRDIKASNVLMAGVGACLIADFECSVGVVGTGFFRALEVLEACKIGKARERGELFTKAVDVYSFGMTCYEMLTGKLPFEGHLGNVYDLVLEGQRPELPKHVGGWIRKLLGRCWHPNPAFRPSSKEVLKILLANSATCRDCDKHRQIYEVQLGLRTTLDRSWRIVYMWRSLKFRFLN